MTDTYPRMNKINELAAELEKELKIRQASIESEIAYAGVLEQGEEADYWERRGYDREEAHSKASDSLEKYRMENGYSSPYDEELKTIAEALTMLEKLKVKE
jgi:hypothetical protein